MRRYEILLLSGDLTRRLGGGRLTNCKSGKDRTGMSVTLEQVHVMSLRFSLDFFDASCRHALPISLALIQTLTHSLTHSLAFPLLSCTCTGTGQHRQPHKPAHTLTLVQARILALSHMLVPRENRPTSRKPAWKVLVRRKGCVGSLGVMCVWQYVCMCATVRMVYPCLLHGPI